MSVLMLLLATFSHGPGPPLVSGIVLPTSSPLPPSPLCFYYCIGYGHPLFAMSTRRAVASSCGGGGPSAPRPSWYGPVRNKWLGPSFKGATPEYMTGEYMNTVGTLLVLPLAPPLLRPSQARLIHAR